MAQVNRSVSFAAVVVAGVLALAGCASKDDHPTTPAAGQSPETSAPPVTTPATTPTEEPTTPTASPTTLTDRLLATSAVPGLNSRWHWTDGVTGAADSKPFGLCAKADLASIGATDVVERTYFPPVDTDDNAGQQIAEFPDATTTTTALKVLKSWAARCASNAPKGVTLKVGAPTTVAGGVWYLVTRTDKNPDDGLFQEVGLVTAGNRISVLTIDSLSQDFTYPAGSEPIVGMIAAAAQLLGA